jgi:hypothetical protein
MQDAESKTAMASLHFHTCETGIIRTDHLSPMNVTTKKSECDPKRRIRQLEVAMEHAKSAADVAVLGGLTLLESEASNGKIEVRYPSFEFRETLRALWPNAGIDGRWTVLDLGVTAAEEACRAACTVLQHYYPDEQFTVGAGQGALANRIV